MENNILSDLVSFRVINAGKSMLNEDQASYDLLYIRKMSSKQQRSSVSPDDSGVRLRHYILKRPMQDVDCCLHENIATAKHY